MWAGMVGARQISLFFSDLIRITDFFISSVFIHIEICNLPFTILHLSMILSWSLLTNHLEREFGMSLICCN